MKRQQFFGTALPAMVFAVSLQAQSMFWLNSASPQVNARVFDSVGQPLEGTNYFVELWGGRTTELLAPALGARSGERVIIPFYLGGYFIDMNPFLRGHPTVYSVQPYHEESWLQVRAWEAVLGNTYEEAVSHGIGGYGESPLFQAIGSDPNDILGQPAPLIGLQSFSLRAVVPEPSTWALLALGGLGLAWISRRGRRLTTDKPKYRW